MIDVEKAKQEIKRNLILESVHQKPTGGQTVGLGRQAFRLYSEELDLNIEIGCYRSNLKNRDLAVTIFELVLDEVIK